MTPIAKSEGLPWITRYSVRLWLVKDSRMWYIATTEQEHDEEEFLQGSRMRETPVGERAEGGIAGCSLGVARGT